MGRITIVLITFYSQDNFREACVVIADTTVARKALVPQKNFIGMTYYQLEYDVVLLFGNTEFKAQIAWKEDVSYRPYCF